MCGFLFSVTNLQRQNYDMHFNEDLAKKILSYRNGYDKRLIQAGTFNLLDPTDNTFEVNYVFARLPTDPLSSPQPVQSSKSATFFNGSIYGFSPSHFKHNDLTSITLSDSILIHESLTNRQACGNFNFLSTLYGTFAIGHIDAKLGHLYLARDCFGERPLFYKITSSHVMVSSDPRAITSVPVLSGNNLSSFITHGFMRDLSNVYPGVVEVLPNTLTIINLYTLEIIDERRIHSFPNEENLSLDYCDVLARSAQFSLAASSVHGKTFIAASSGIDSRFLLHTLSNRLENTAIYNATFHTNDEIYSEFEGLRHHVSLQLPNLYKFLENISINVDACFDRLVWSALNRYSLSNGCFNLEALLLAVNKSKCFRYCLTGLGLDELIGGYNSFKYWPFFSRIPVSLWHRVNPRFYGADLLPNSGNNHKVLLFYFLYRLDIGSLCLLQSPGIRIEVLKNSWVAFCSLMTKLNIINHIASPQLILSLCEAFDYMSMQVLRDYDQISHAYSVDIRNPFLTPSLLFARKDSKKLLKQRSVIQRKKTGFSFPLPNFIPQPANLLSYGDQSLVIDPTNSAKRHAALKFFLFESYQKND